MLRFKSLNSAAGNAAEIEFVGANSGNGASSLALSGLGLQQGDLVVAVASADATTFSVSSSGWTGYNTSFSLRDRTNSISHIICYKEMGATPDSTFSLDATVDFIGAIAFRNAQWDSNNDYVNDQTSGFTVGTSCALPSLSISTSGSAAVYLAMLDDDNATVSTTPTNYTLATENGRTGGSGAIFYRLDLSSGTESPSNMSWSSNDAFLNFGVVLEPV